LDPGKLRHRITIQEPISIQDTYGQPNVWIDVGAPSGIGNITDEVITAAIAEPWADVATIWASIEPLSGREFFAAQQVNAEVTTRIRTRYLAGIKSSMRVVYGSRIFDIQSIIDIEERHTEMHLMCKELPQNG